MIQRQQQSPYGRDGQSDRRSGVAAASLQRMMNPWDSKRGPGPYSRPNMPNSPRGDRKDAPNTGPMRDPNRNARKPPKTDPSRTPQEDRFTRKEALRWSKKRWKGMDVPNVRVTKDGIIQLPYSDDFSQAQYDAVTGANAELMGLKTAADQQGIEFQNQQRLLGQEYVDTRRGTLAANASGGTAFSSKYGTEVAENAQDYANELGGLQNQNAEFQRNQALQKQAIAHALSQQLGLAVHGVSKEFDEQAGELGFGRGGTPIIDETIASKRTINKTYNQRNAANKKIQQLKKGGITKNERDDLKRLRNQRENMNDRINEWERKSSGPKKNKGKNRPGRRKGPRAE